MTVALPAQIEDSDNLSVCDSQFSSWEVHSGAQFAGCRWHCRLPDRCSIRSSDRESKLWV